ncbi:MAG: hypothetical protein AABX11_07655 [Nanoarchaeota archaeon]
MAEIIFKDGIIQKGGRIKIPKAVIDTLELNEGQGVLIKYESDSEKLVIEFEKKGKNGKK